MVSSTAPNRSESLGKPPEISRWLQNGFHRFLGSYLRKHFDAVGVDSQSLTSLEMIPGGSTNRLSGGDIIPSQSKTSLIIYANHPSWWDPLLAQFLNHKLFPDRQFYAPIDASALDQYRVLKKLGFYGVELGKIGGVKKFLRLSTSIAECRTNVIWITPEGKFTDPRDQTNEWMPGLGHLCQRLDSGYAVPIAMEYVFWNEPRPLCVSSIGAPQSIESLKALSKEQCNTRLKDELRSTQKRLQDLVIPRQSTPFHFLLAGKTGPFGLYRHARKLSAFLRGQRFQERHGESIK